MASRTREKAERGARGKKEEGDERRKGEAGDKRGKGKGGRGGHAGISQSI